MSVTLTPSSTTTLNSEDLRLWIRDYAGNNRLLDQVEFSANEIDKAIDLAVDEYNITTPISSLTASGIPKSLLIKLGASWLIQSEAFLQLRNQATYQDGNVQNIGIDDKHLTYLQFSRALREEALTSLREYKKNLNAEGGYGNISSGYRYTTRIV